MNKLDTYKRISKIHAIKCYKATTEKEAIESFNTASSLKNDLESLIAKDELGRLNDEVNNWAGNKPIANDAEVEQLMRNKK
ncbi:MAG: hypothetical protein WD555_05140 [Fulvivirga sp.]